MTNQWYEKNKQKKLSSFLNAWNVLKHMVITVEEEPIFDLDDYSKIQHLNNQ